MQAPQQKVNLLLITSSNPSIINWFGRFHISNLKTGFYIILITDKYIKFFDKTDLRKYNFLKKKFNKND